MLRSANVAISPLRATGTDRNTILSLGHEETSNQGDRDARLRRSCGFQCADGDVGDGFAPPPTGFTETEAIQRIKASLDAADLSINNMW